MTGPEQSEVEKLDAFFEDAARREPLSEDTVRRLSEGIRQKLDALHAGACADRANTKSRTLPTPSFHRLAVAAGLLIVTASAAYCFSEWSAAQKRELEVRRSLDSTEVALAESIHAREATIAEEQRIHEILIEKEQALADLAERSKHLRTSLEKLKEDLQAMAKETKRYRDDSFRLGQALEKQEKSLAAAETTINELRKALTSRPLAAVSPARNPVSPGRIEALHSGRTQKSAAPAAAAKRAPRPK
jgi:hypothetical protein